MASGMFKYVGGRSKSECAFIIRIESDYYLPVSLAHFIWLSKTTTLACSCFYWYWCWRWDRRQLKKKTSKFFYLKVAVTGALSEADVIFSLRCQSLRILFSWRASWARSPLLEPLLPWPLRGSWGRGFSRGSSEFCFWKSAFETHHQSQPSEVCSNRINKTEIHLSSVLKLSKSFSHCDGDAFLLNLLCSRSHQVTS